MHAFFETKVKKSGRLQDLSMFIIKTSAYNNHTTMSPQPQPIEGKGYKGEHRILGGRGVGKNQHAKRAKFPRKHISPPGIFLFFGGGDKFREGVLKSKIQLNP